MVKHDEDLKPREVNGVVKIKRGREMIYANRCVCCTRQLTGREKRRAVEARIPQQWRQVVFVGLAHVECMARRAERALEQEEE